MMSPEQIGTIVGNGLVSTFLIFLPLWIFSEDWRDGVDRKWRRQAKLAKAVKGSQWRAYVEYKDENGWNCGSNVPVTIVSASSEYNILVKINETGEEKMIGGLDYLGEFISAPNIKKNKRRSKMPKIIRWGLYLALLKLVWMGVANAPAITQFVVAQFVH